MTIRPLAVFDVPLRTSFRGQSRRDGMLVAGNAGIGEFSPFWDYGDKESAAWLRCAIEAADGDWPAPVRGEIPVNVTVPAVSAEEAHAIVQRGGGCRTAKVKVAAPGDGVGAEVARLEAVRDALGPGGRIRIDANGLWDVDEALRRLSRLDRAAGGLEYAEQPVMSIEDLGIVRRRQQVPIAADESIRRADDPLRVIRAEAADIAVVKVQPLGGVREALRIAERIEIPIVVSSALESSIGLRAGIALAAALPELPYACGLGTAMLLEQDVVDSPLVPSEGVMSVADALAVPLPELAFEPANEEITHRWLRRFDRVMSLLG
ncbi:o-succinylbenzoate synthase [Rarobacter faecitabidus]|uniref:o-succinylbenzoate synthase n=1 Tax=Rarobacter faecitabidus TaxID=13243 RepID=A0A542ZTR9_RARFA|nr:o-succinylbenzoate synthase [Rarobacter faecitabidus]TQL63754.1 O-succinylbenzoate synthase [Rarobacter faecitabidus]